jgi:hypothetical protein
MAATARRPSVRCEAIEPVATGGHTCESGGAAIAGTEDSPCIDGFEHKARETPMPNVQVTSPLDPQSLAKNVTAQVSTALMSQARALVVARQQDAAAYIDDPALAVRTRDSQEELRRDVDYYLNRALPDVVGRLTDASGAASFVAALATTLGTADGRQAPADLLGAALEQFEQYRSGAADLADSLSAASTRTAGRAAGLAALLQQQIDALEGPDGQLQKTKDSIAETAAAIDADISGIVTAADKVGSGVKTWLLDKIKVVTGTLSSFGGGDDEEADAPAPKQSSSKTKKTAADGGDTGEDAGDGGDTGDDPAPVKKKKFDVTGMDVDVDRSGDDGTGETSQGSADLGAAVAAFRKHNAQLADLYLALARQKSELAVAAAIGDQAAGFARSLDSASACAATLAATWQSLLDAATTLQDKTDPAQLAGALAAAATGATAHWTALAAELDYARSALAGKRGAIPDVGPLPSAAGN